MTINVQQIFQASRNSQLMGDLGAIMRQMDKAPSTLRGLSDFVSKERKSATNSALFEELNVGRNNVYAVSVSWLYVEEGLNLREVDVERAEMFKNAYLNHPSSVPAIRVKVVVVDGVTRLKIIDGHHRYTGLMAAIAEGAVFEKLIIEEFEGGKDEEVFNMIESANTKHLKMIERAEGFRRLVEWGHEIDVIARRLGLSSVTIRRSLILAKAEERVKKLVREDKVSGDVAIDVLTDCQGTDRDAYDILIASLAKAEQAGKTKVTARYVSSPKKTKVKPKVVRQTFESLLPTLDQLRSQIPPAPTAEHENQIEIAETVPEEVILRLSPEVARQLMAALSDVEAAKLEEEAEKAAQEAADAEATEEATEAGESEEDGDTEATKQQ
ncbi:MULTISPECIES: ParB/RepB/Spo0J family partition protein [Morganellaceae]|uniref:ParB/Spo0J HTH domain-containing protein n=1 Tax=Morganella psychrotolerans TaxID=368603 RepID=A0A1B8HMK7_9GAMM|nr:ParB/RepB/Spo0J family partition protein [Morganella psychrotolerans]OBU10587.1 hypothetical protein AYY17_15725 [Morganella psychrotolerans]